MKALTSVAAGVVVVISHDGYGKQGLMGKGRRKEEKSKIRSADGGR